MKKKEKKEKKYPIVYDYWVDIDRQKVYAIVEYARTLKQAHSNVFLVCEKYHGNKKERESK